MTRDRWGWLNWGIAGLLVGLTGAVVGRTFWPRASEPQSPSPPPLVAGAVEALAWSPDGERLAAVVGENAVCAWRLPGETPELVARVPVGGFSHNTYLTDVAWSPDGRVICGRTYNERAFLWDSASARLAEVASDVAWSPDARHLVVRTADGTAEIRVTASGRVLETLKTLGGLDDVKDWSPDSRLVPIETSTGCALWSRDRGILPARPALGSWIGYQFFWSPDGRYLATFGQEGGFSDRDAKVWDTSTGKLHATLPGHEDLLECDWSPDGRILATTDGETTVLWDAARKRRLRSLAGGGWRSSGPRWSAHGSAYVTSHMADNGASGAVSIWEVERGRQQRRLRYENSVAPVVSPRGDWVALADGRTIALLEVNGPGLRRLPTAVADHSRLNWSPDGRYLVVKSSSPARYEVWDANTRLRRAALTLESDLDAPGLQWSPDGRRLALADGSGARVWDAVSGGVSALRLR